MDRKVSVTGFLLSESPAAMATQIQTLVCAFGLDTLRVHTLRFHTQVRRVASYM